MSEPGPMTELEQALLDLLEDGHVGPDNVITQLDAGRQLGITGDVSTVRRKVQKVRDAILEKHEIMIFSTSRPPNMGMYLPEEGREAEKRAKETYYAEVKARALSGLAKAEKIDRYRARQLLREIQQELGFDEDHQGPPPDTTRAPIASLPCRANLRPGQRPTDNQPNGNKCWCGAWLRGRQVKYCSEFHEQLANGRRKGAQERSAATAPPAIPRSMTSQQLEP